MAKVSSYINRNGLTTDIYDIADYVNKVKKEFTPEVDEDTLMLGIFGYFGSLMSDMFQNDIIMAAEFANESIATRAKFDKNVIAHALGLNFTSINAEPAQMEVLLTFFEDEIIKAIGGGSGEFIFDRDSKIYFDTLEFHTDYDIIIKRIQLLDGSYTYAAMYDMTGEGRYENPVSDITNPYLVPPQVYKYNGTRYLIVDTLIRQVEKSTIYKKVLSDNTISSKTVNFEFESQMAAFDVDCTAALKKTHLVPVYDGLSYVGKYSWIWFTYLDTSTIRLKFDRDSYQPRTNADIEINLQTTQGEKGNFTWIGPTPVFSFDSERLGYSNITVEIKPKTNQSLYGSNKKTIDELKRIIPREALSRGSITNTKDLYNFFNAIDTDASQMYLYKKRDNCWERLYYTYMVMKDSRQNIIPTNTINLMIRPDQLYTDTNRARLILRKGQIIRLAADGVTGFISRFSDTQDLDYSDSFFYRIPYNFAISLDPIYGMYFLTTMDESRSLTFSYINEDCLYQYISTYIQWCRNYLSEDDTYRMTMTLMQNFSDNDVDMIVVDDDGNIVESKIRVLAVFYNEEGKPHRYIEGTPINFNQETNIVTFEFVMRSNDYLDKSNNIRIEGVKPVGMLSDLISYGYLPSNCKTMLHVLTKQPEYSTNMKFRDYFGDVVDLTEILPKEDFTDWSICNSYEVNGGVNFFYDYSEIIYSTISPRDGEYIPPDEPDPPKKPDDGYEIGGGQLDPDPDDRTLATEAGVADAVRRALIAAFGYMPRFTVGPNGELFIEDPNKEVYATVDHDSPTMVEGDTAGVDLGFPGGPVGKMDYPDIEMMSTIVEEIFKKVSGYPVIFVQDPNDKYTYDVIISKPNSFVSTGAFHLLAGTYGVFNMHMSNGVKDAYYEAGQTLDNFCSAIETMIPQKNTDPAVDLTFEINCDGEDRIIPSDPTVRSLMRKMGVPMARAIAPGDIQDIYDEATGKKDEEEGGDPEDPDDIPGKDPDETDKPQHDLKIGGDTIDYKNADDRTLATEEGAQNLINDMVQAVKDNVPEITDQGNGVLRMDSPIMGTAILGAGEDADKYMPEYEPEPPKDPDSHPGHEDNGTEEPGIPDYKPPNASVDILGDSVIPTEDGIGIMISPEEAKRYHFIIENVPVVKYNYFRDEDMVQFFASELIRRKNYIDEVIKQLEDTFGLNFKFVNTYGPSKLFTLDNYGRYLNRVNMSLTFRIGLQVNFDPNIVTYIKEDIKEYVEDINQIRSIHMSNLVSAITEKYKESIRFFEFVDFNGYGPDDGHLYSMEMPENVITPEMVNINTLDDFSPDITIIIA